MTTESPNEQAAGRGGDADGRLALAPVADLLADEAMWSAPPPLLFDEVLAAMARPAAHSGADATVAVLARHRPARRWWFAAAAAAVLVIGAVGYAVGRSGGDAATNGADALVAELALAGTALAPDARAEVDVFDRGAGYALLLDTTGLAPASDDSYYEGWLRSGSGDQVSIGTFHMRSGDDTVVLWSGVPIEDFPELVVTHQTIASTAPGETVMAGRWRPTGRDVPGSTVAA